MFHIPRNRSILQDRRVNCKFTHRPSFTCGEIETFSFRRCTNSVIRCSRATNPLVDGGPSHDSTTIRQLRRTQSWCPMGNSVRCLWYNHIQLANRYRTFIPDKDPTKTRCFSIKENRVQVLNCRWSSLASTIVPSYLREQMFIEWLLNTDLHDSPLY